MSVEIDLDAPAAALRAPRRGRAAGGGDGGDGALRRGEDLAARGGRRPAPRRDGTRRGRTARRCSTPRAAWRFLPRGGGWATCRRTRGSFPT